MVKTVKYKVALVTYRDILGFKELVNTQTAGEISRIIRVFKEETQPDQFKLKLAGFQKEDFANFSDLMIISIPLRNPNAFPQGKLFSHLLHLARAQAILICGHRIVVRGGVTVGNMVRSRGQLYGPGIVRAYELESEVANSPRIVVGQEVLKELRMNPGLWVHDRKTDEQSVRDLLCRDADGHYFVELFAYNIRRAGRSRHGVSRPPEQPSYAY